MDEKERRKEVEEIVELVLNDYGQDRDIDKMDIFKQPDRVVVEDIVRKMMRVLFPGYYRDKEYKFYNAYNKLTVLLEDIMYNLTGQITMALAYDPDYQGADDRTLEEAARSISVEFFRQIPKIRDYIETDIQATFDGDPAAFNKEEIVLSYPGLKASTIYRVAHELQVQKVPMIPRMMTEFAHSETGIDIHPNATIGRYFFMDHGTGIVVGSTSIIGEHVRVYQGVTIGALSLKGGHDLHGTRRHPTIEDRVTIYSGASILGGRTVIGHDSVIGSNAFITRSVDPYTRISIKNQELRIDSDEQGNAALDSRPVEPDDSWFYMI
ncbi:MAG: serine O-acetyltransferase [Eubacteriales bacterium]|nr:serine O-acetyltransferase [Eubacteriales bacterium]